MVKKLSARATQTPPHGQNVATVNHEVNVGTVFLAAVLAILTEKEIPNGAKGISLVTGNASVTNGSEVSATHIVIANARKIGIARTGIDETTENAIRNGTESGRVQVLRRNQRERLRLYQRVLMTRGVVRLQEMLTPMMFWVNAAGP